MNSTPSTLARIMRLTALQPPPPTPITLIFAPSCNSSATETRMLDSFAMLPPQCYNFRIFQSAAGPDTVTANKICRLSISSRPRKHTFQLAHEARRTSAREAPRARSVDEQPHSRRILGPGNLFAHLSKAARHGDTHGQIEQPL